MSNPPEEKPAEIETPQEATPEQRAENTAAKAELNLLAHLIAPPVDNPTDTLKISSLFPDIFM